VSVLPGLVLAQMPPWWWLQHAPLAVFVFCFGACVGSFLNVVIYRLPAGMSVISPPSRCPTCGARLKVYENLPIIGYFIVRGRCRYCKVNISAQYMIVELLIALMFLGLYMVLYAVKPWNPLFGTGTLWWGEIGGPWWYQNGIWTFPAFIAMAFMLAGLIAMTVIDARTFTIPIQIPLFVTFTAFVAYLVQAFMPLKNTAPQTWPIPALCWPGALLVTGGMLGVLVSYLLLRSGRIRYSFADYADYLPKTSAQDLAPISTDRVTPFELIFFLPLAAGLIAIGFLGAIGGLAVGLGAAVVIAIFCRLTGTTFGPESEPNADNVLATDYPHARREMFVEILFLAPCIILAGIGLWLARFMPQTPPPVFVQALAGSFAGYLMGGGLIWGIRILGTLGFGREAMGLGDVHLLGAIGAVVGWFDPILIFFIAPFSGLLWAVLSMGIASVFKRARRELPYGPHLAVATLVVILCRPGLHDLWTRFMPNVPWPKSGLCQTARKQQAQPTSPPLSHPASPSSPATRRSTP
jgi:leader peptidase (prepilin peptidase) / N-methyltransferase